MKTLPSENWRTSSCEETALLGNALAATLFPGAILALHGELGAGKTSFVRGLAEGLGINSLEVCSPTFSLLNIYTGRFPLYHFDLYRLPNSAAFFDAGFDEYLYTQQGICCIEWAEKIQAQLPSHTLLLTFSHVSPCQREIQLRALKS